MFDIPPRLRTVLAVAAAGGFIFIIMGSLTGGKGASIELDKLVHGTGYALLGMLVIMGLPPKWYIPALAGIVLAGVGLEYAQATVVKGRSFDVSDATANAKGLLAGSCIGFLGRLLWAFLRGELESLAEHRRLRHYADRETIFKEGDPSEFIYVVREGKVVVKHGDGDNSTLATLGAGEVFGEMGVVGETPRSATVVADGDVVVYQMEGDKLFVPVEGREHPAIPIARALAKRLSDSNEQIAKLR
ncbi:MAG: cyclic nucleotide-binding domain-containing protein [Verrucomicrobiales bacterium]